MKLKLIDEDWVDEQIKNTVTLFKDNINPYTTLLNRVKEQLQSPIEEIKEAIEHGLNAYPEFDRTSNYDYESRKEGLKEIQDEYLKEKGYE